METPTMTRRALLLTLLATFPGIASAHLPAGSRGPNGGQVQDLGPYHGEMLAQDGVLTLFLFDHQDRPVDARQANGSAIVLVDGQQRSVPFEPKPDGSALVARGDFAVAPGLRVVVQVVPGPGISRAQARFTPAG